jgi:four helix bundle protein
MGDYKKLAVWEKSHQLTLTVYQLTADFPVEERYGLTGQMRRSATSIPTNIAEGSGRGGDAELVRFLRIAAGSASELEYQILLAHDLGFINDDDYQRLDEQVGEVLRMLAGLTQSLSRRPK